METISYRKSGSRRETYLSPLHQPYNSRLVNKLSVLIDSSDNLLLLSPCLRLDSLVQVHPNLLALEARIQRIFFISVQENLQFDEQAELRLEYSRGKLGTGFNIFVRKSVGNVELCEDSHLVGGGHQDVLLVEVSGAEFVLGYVP